VVRIQLPAFKQLLTATQILFLLIFFSNCSWFRVKKTTQIPVSKRALPARTADQAELVRLLNSTVQDLQTLNLAVVFEFTGGSINTGEVANYRETKGFILIKKPNLIRTIVLAFNVKVMDMVSNGTDFYIDVPPKNKFIHGLNYQKIRPRKDIPVSLRPQHIQQAIALDPVGTPSDENPIVVEEDQEGPKKYYILNLLGKTAVGDWSMRRKIWFDRFDLNIVRQKIFGDHGQIASDISYSDFKNFEGKLYPTEINFKRPQEDYSLRIRINKARINKDLEDDKFVLQKPPKAELVELAEESKMSGSESVIDPHGPSLSRQLGFRRLPHPQEFPN